MINMGSWQGT
jgi:hypothetical protein